jgi:hypothetical protein
MAETEDRDLELVRRHVHQLAEHFDTVQVFVTRHRGREGTENVVLGAGNWFARYGHVYAWLHDEEDGRMVGSRPEDPDDDDDA